MAAYPPFTMEMLKEVLNSVPKRINHTVYISSKIVKLIYPHLSENIDESCTYIVEIPFGEFKSADKNKNKKKHKRKNENKF